MEREIVVELPVVLVDLLDSRAYERNMSRSTLIRVAVERLVAEAVEENIDQRIIAGYTARPQAGTWGDDRVRSLIREEPW